MACPVDSELRIGIDASNLRNGGGLSHLIQLVGAADPVRHGFAQITVWGGRDTLNKLPQDCDWLDLRDHPWLNHGSLKRVAWRKSHLPRELSQSSNLLFAPGGLIAETDLPRVTMCRNMMPFEPRERARATGFGRIRFELLKRAQVKSFVAADGVIFLTDYAQQAVLEQMPQPPKYQTVIPHGVAPRFLQPPKPQRPLSEYSKENPFRLFYASSVNVYKHQWAVVEAAAELRSAGAPIRLDLVGVESDAKSVAQLNAALHKHDPEQEFIEWPGAVPFERMHELYRKADAFIFASSCENLPNILLEAMSAGLPTLSSRSGPMPDILGPKGFYFDVDSPGALARELGRMLDNPEAREAAAVDAFARASEYSWERCADATFAALSEVAQGKPKR